MPKLGGSTLPGPGPTCFGSPEAQSVLNRKTMQALNAHQKNANAITKRMKQNVAGIIVNLRRMARRLFLKADVEPICGC